MFSRDFLILLVVVCSVFLYVAGESVTFSQYNTRACSGSPTYTQSTVVGGCLSSTSSAVSSKVICSTSTQEIAWLIYPDNSCSASNPVVVAGPAVCVYSNIFNISASITCSPASSVSSSWVTALKALYSRFFTYAI